MGGCVFRKVPLAAVQDLGCQGTKVGGNEGIAGRRLPLHGSEAVNLDRVDGCFHVSWVGTEGTHA